MKKTMVVIDGNSLLFRAFYAVPPTLKAPDGTPTNAVYGFLNTYLRILKEFDPAYVVVAMDEHAPTFRHKFFDGYKGTRKETPPEFIEQSQYFLPLLAEMNIAVSSCAGFEADDVLGKWSAECDKLGIECLIVTGDRDSLQLITDNTNVILAKNLPGGGTDFVRFDRTALTEKYGMSPTQFIDLKALMGDTSDNIPGVKGIGEKTGVSLITQYGSLDGVYEHIDEIKGKLGEKLVAGKQDAYDSKYLATIVREVPVEPDWQAAQRKLPSADARRSFARYGFTSLIGKFEFDGASSAPAETDTSAPEKTVTLHTPAEVQTAVAAMHGDTAVLFGNAVTLYNDTTLYILPVRLDLLSDGMDMSEILDSLKSFLADASVGKIAADTKALRYFLGDYELNGVVDDVCLGEYLIDCVTQDYSVKRLMNKYLGKYEGEPDAYDLYRIAQKVRLGLKATGTEQLYRELELPLERVLYDMEKAGFTVNREELAEAGKQLDGQITALINEIYASAGETFNVNSPKQLGSVLFEKLGIIGVKKNKNGSYPTDADTLESVSEQNEIVDKILEYRKLTKLRNTYVEGLLTALNRSGDGKIHTRFMTTATATGRLSSTEPNLQNIPVRSARGKELRKAFSASAGCILVDADYSQIELRVMAHMAREENMLRAFAEGKDIHAATAARVMGVPLDEVTPEMRASAKAVNFGIIYGISEFGLARNIGISRWQAGEFINRYFTEYPGVRRFTDAMVADGERDGFVRTMFGRRREMSELTSSNYNERQFGKRVAVNMPVQGTAADIIKKAMLLIAKELRDEKLKARMIMQIHDEIILDTPRDEAEQVQALVRRCMENAVALDVALKVEIHTAENWYDCK